MGEHLLSAQTTAGHRCFLHTPMVVRVVVVVVVLVVVLVVVQVVVAVVVSCRRQ